jgi:voltage-gated potassium channel
MAPIPPQDEPLDEGSLPNLSYELFILLLSILSIINLALELFLRGAAAEVIFIGDAVMSIFFLGDFLLRLHRAERPRDYVVHGWGWADFLAIFPLLRIFRLFRIVRVMTRLHRLGGPRIVRQLLRRRGQSAFGVTVFLVILVVEISGGLIVGVEQTSPDANISTGGDAVWWAYVTITTVGYGDKYPVTDFGRVLGVLLLTAGVALFSVLTGFVARFFLGAGRMDDDEVAEPALPMARPVDPFGEYADLGRLLDEQEARTAELRRRITDLEAAAAGHRTEPGARP